jgi:hypothetical protein
VERWRPPAPGQLDRPTQLKELNMKQFIAPMIVVLTSAVAASATAETIKYPPFSAYSMNREAEIALARSAAPDQISGRATVKILGGYIVAAEGDNGFVCIVMRGWGAPTYTVPTRDLVYDAAVRAPICYDQVAARTVLPYQELRTKLAIEGKTPDQIAGGVQAAYAKAELPKMELAFAYMFSADMNLGPGVGHFHLHMMVFALYYNNAMLGGNSHDSMLPRNTDDEGTPFTVIVIPVDRELAVKSKVSTN